MAAFSIHGDIVWTEEFGSFRSVEDGYLTIEDGKIKRVSKERPNGKIIDKKGFLIIPGLSDLHLHAPQYAFAGLYMDEELLEWLNNHTFPEEAKYSDHDYADKAYSALVDALKKGPSTRVSVFGTIHTDTVILLMKKLEEAGLAGFVGKVNMDRNSPSFLQETTDDSVKETERFIRMTGCFSNIKPIITPRFVPSCSDDLMRELSRIAKENDLPLQSHLDENLSEIDWVKELCPWSRSYGDVYRHFEMLGESSIMAHCVWLNEEEIEILSTTGTYIAHSPSSNTNLSSGIAPVRRYIEAGCKIGLATDVAGGSSLSIFRIIQDAIGVSKLRWRFDEKSGSPLKFAEAFYLASKGGGSYFGKVGSFEEGYDADVVVLDDSESSVLRGELSPEERLEYYVYRHAECPVESKFVRGRLI